MKRFLFAMLLMAFLAGCKESDWRDPYTGTFNFTCRKSTMVTDDVKWNEISIDTTYFTSDVVLESSDRIKIQFGTGTIGVDLDSGNDSLYMTVKPIIKKNGELEFPSAEYPQGCHNHIEGKYLTTDTIRLDISYGYLIGGYDKYQIVGVRVR